ncbi:MAG TPA: hypothetical protein VNO21_27165 [Polyangiaceae bacterium]|nr:hypothetical protein [Polyangiaceae bacterium]
MSLGRKADPTIFVVGPTSLASLASPSLWAVVDPYGFRDVAVCFAAIIQSVAVALESSGMEMPAAAE